MSNEERLDWLCRLRSFLVSVGMPKQWRTNFNEALATTIDYEKVLADIKAEIERYRAEQDKKDTFHFLRIKMCDDFAEIIDNHIAKEQK